MISKKIFKKFSLILSIFFITICFNQKIAFAAETAKTGNLIKGTSEAGHAYDLTEFLTMAENIYDIVVKIAIPCAAVSLAMAGFRMLFGSYEEFNSAKNQIIITAVAIAGILLLPPFINLGLELGSNYGWTPKIENNDSLRSKLTQATIDRHANEKEDDVDKENQDKNGEQDTNTEEN